MAEKKNIAAKVEELIRESVEAAGYLLWDVDYYKEGADYNLLVTIENPDRATPVGLEDCEKVTRLIDPILDEADPIPQAYYLEVSSAGLERTLSRPQHLAFYKGFPVTAKLLTLPNRAMNEDILFAKQKNIPILPLMMENEIDGI